MSLRRRMFLQVGGAMSLGACGLGLGPQARVQNEVGSVEPFTKRIQELEATLGGELGVCAIDIAAQRGLGYRQNERFAMASTFKWVLGAAILAQVHADELHLEEQISFTENDLLEWAPVTREHVKEGSLSVEALARAAVCASDNTAANLLLARVGGPSGLTQFMRDQGDSESQLNRFEPTLNENAPGDVRDTTTPHAMAELLRQLLVQDGLPEPQRKMLEGWMRDATTGRKRLRSGLPMHWSVGNKSGSGGRNAINDVAIVRTPDGRALVIACYTTGGTASMAEHESAIARVAELVVLQLGLS